MSIASHTVELCHSVLEPCVHKNRRHASVSTVLLSCLSIVLAVSGCGQTAKPVTSSATGTVDSYFGGPFNDGDLAASSSSFDHTANQVSLSGFLTNTAATSPTIVPTQIINGSFATAGTGFLSITENFAETEGVIAPQNPPLAGAWAVEIPGAGVLANFLSFTPASANSPASVAAAPTAMAENTTCPNFATHVPFLYVTVPNKAQKGDTADYGITNIGTQGSAVTFTTQPYLIGPLVQSSFAATGGCSNTNLGELTAYPLNSFAVAYSPELISIGTAGFLVSSFNPIEGGLGAFGGGTGVIGVSVPAQPVNVSAVVGAHYNGFFYAPDSTSTANYDITVLASAYGDYTATSSACSVLQSSLEGNNGQGANTISVLPSANSLYGGEFLSTGSSGVVNDPSGASGTENCDVVIDLGSQDPTTNGLFPSATVFIGSNYPPFNNTTPWYCSGAPCAVSFPAAAVVGTIQGQYVILVVGSSVSNPPAQLPVNAGGTPVAQPIGIYLFQNPQ